MDETILSRRAGGNQDQPVPGSGGPASAPARLKMLHSDYPQQGELLARIGALGRVLLG